MNKLFILLLAVCLVSVHAFVKRDAPETATKGSNVLEDFSKKIGDAFEEAKKQLDPEKLKAQWDEMAKKIEPLTEAFVRRDVSSPAAAEPNILELIQKNLDQFRKCLDQSLASAVDDINENKLKPVLTQVGGLLNRVSKAFDDLTAPVPPKST